MNLLPLAPSDTRFALLPAVDTWSHHAAAASEGEGHSSAHVSSPTARPHGGSGKGGAGGGGGSSGGGKAGGVGAPLGEFYFSSCLVKSMCRICRDIGTDTAAALPACHKYLLLPL